MLSVGWLAGSYRGGGRIIFDAAAWRPTGDELAAPRLDRDLHVGEPGRCEPVFGLVRGGGTDTYWYLTATPELLQHALLRVEQSERGSFA